MGNVLGTPCRRLSALAIAVILIGATPVSGGEEKDQGLIFSEEEARSLILSRDPKPDATLRQLQSNKRRLQVEQADLARKLNAEPEFAKTFMSDPLGTLQDSGALQVVEGPVRLDFSACAVKRTVRSWCFVQECADWDAICTSWIEIGGQAFCNGWSAVCAKWTVRVKCCVE